MNRRLIVIAALCVAALEAMTQKPQEEILTAIKKERKLQDDIWGGKEHDENHYAIQWLFLITKHVGKLAQSLPQPDSRDYRDMRDQIAITGRSTEQFI